MPFTGTGSDYAQFVKYNLNICGFSIHCSVSYKVLCTFMSFTRLIPVVH